VLIKAYIKKHMFHLPTQNNEQLETQVEKELHIEVDQSQFFKVYPLTKIEDNENILVENQRTNIFLLNLLLIVLKHNKKLL
jgi:chlorite dismutase